MGNDIYTLIPACMEDIKAIGKDSMNQQQKFAYRGIDAVMNALQPVLSKHKVFVVPEVIEQRREEVSSKSGGQLHYSLLTVKYTFYAPDGSSVSAVVVGEGMDSGDKASNKAMSVAFKYACFQVFCIQTEEMVDPDGESHETIRDWPTCPDCGNAVGGVRLEDGREFSPEDILKKFGCCYPCHKAKKEAANAQ